MDDLSKVTTLIKQNKSLKEQFYFLKNLNKSKNGLYQMPIKLNNGEITDLNMYILNEDALKKEEMNVFFSLNTHNLGLVQIYFSLKDNKVNLNINSSDNSSLKCLEKYKFEIEDVLKNFNIKNFNINFGIEQEKNFYHKDFKNIIEGEFNKIY